MEKVTNFIIENEKIKKQYSKLKPIVEELKDLGVLVDEGLQRYNEEMQSIMQFYQSDFKFAFLIQGEMNAGKSTCLNALLGERILAVSSVPETNFLTCIVHDRSCETPLLYKTSLEKIYNSRTATFHLDEDNLEFTEVSGTNNIFNYLNGSNVESRKKMKELIEKAEEEENQAINEQMKKDLYKDTTLDDTLYVIKYKIPWLEEKIKDEFILKRVMFIDFPGMFEFGHHKITEIYKVFEDNNQGVIHILHPLGYQSNIITKLQNFQKYPNRMLIIVNKMDQISIDDSSDSNGKLDLEDSTAQKKAQYLVEKVENSLRRISNNASDDSQKTKYLEMGNEVPKIVNFVKGKEELMRRYVMKYRNSNDPEDKVIFDSILRACAQEDQTYTSLLRESKKEKIPFAEMDFFDDYDQEENNLFDVITESISNKIKIRFNELISQEIPNKLNSIQSRLIEMIEKLIQPEIEKKGDDDVHSFIKCDGCGANPLPGIRYKCTVCPDFDFCEGCKKSKDHPLHEFEAIPKEDLAQMAVNNFIDASGTLFLKLEELLIRFNSDFNQLITAGCNSETYQSIETSLRNFCENHLKDREEVIQQITKIIDSFIKQQIAVGVAWEKKKGVIVLLIVKQSMELMKEYINSYVITKKFLLASCANLLQAMITLTLKKPIPSLTQLLFEGLGDIEILLTNEYNENNKAYNFNELIANFVFWKSRFDCSVDFTLGQNLQSIKNFAVKLKVLISLEESFTNLFSDKKKSEELNKKLATILQKLNDIPKLEVS